jgi:hypothetical protein
MSRLEPPLATSTQRGATRLVDVLWLGAAERRARSYSSAQLEKIAAYHAGAAVRLAAARDLRDAARIAAAGAVYREAALLTAFALVAAAEPATEVEALGAQALFARLQDMSSDFALPPRRLERFRAGLAEAERLVTDPDRLALDRSKPIVAVERLEKVHAVLERLLGRVEPRSARQIRRSRWLRLSTIALVSLLVTTTLFVYALSPNNVARGKPVATRVHDPRTPPLGRLVNGEVENSYGASTGRVKNAWFRIDLGKPHEILRIAIHNRNDRWARESTPFLIELSDDGRSFREVTRFTGPAEPRQRFTWKAGRETARYVQVRKLDHRGLALNEIEVFGYER